MKRSVLFLAPLLLAGGRLACGQTAPSLSLEVQPVSAGATVQSSTGTSTSSITGRTYTSSSVHTTSAKESLQIKLHNFSAAPGSAKVQWYFVAAPLVPEAGKPAEDQEFVFDQGAQDVTLAGGGTQTLGAESAEVTSSRKVSGGRGSSSRRSSSFSMKRGSTKPAESGSKLRGWLVRVVTADGKTVAARGSTQTYEEIAQDDESLQDLLDGAPPQEARSKKRKTPAAATKSPTTNAAH